MAVEQSLVLIKHDGVSRNLIGKIINRIEDIGLKICAMKMSWADEELAKNHYHLSEEWAKEVFEKTKKSKEEKGETFEFTDPLEYGKIIQSMNINFLREGPVVAMIIEGPHAIEIIRKIVGATEPLRSPPGTIRGDFASIDSYKIANDKKRAVRNLIHASDSPKNADHEISLWFNKDEIHSYSKDIEKHF